MIPERVGAVVNPYAGGGNAAARFAELADCFPDAAVDARITTSSNDVGAAAREQAEWGDIVVVIGGDGTLREVAAALIEAGSETPLFVVPAGRGNSAYRHLYGGEDWQAIARKLAGGVEVRPLEVGCVESDPHIDPTYFVLGFTAGVFRNALENAERFRALPGPVAYVLATAQAALVDDPVSVTVDVDGEPFFDGRARLVAIGGGRYRGSDFELLPESRPGDDLLHALSIEPTGIDESVRLGRLARVGRLREHPAVSYATGERVTVRSADGLPVELDGTPVPTPLRQAELTVVPAAVRVAYPKQ
ncbi:MAG: diacylglycerol kinase (ATP) [Natronomonas sp.]|uniref:diacylglycerol/lipid kinase family protein n=1 Tax=Natronomonas sp. TaxID=2184060 RepID=UPI003989EA38